MLFFTLKFFFFLLFFLLIFFFKLHSFLLVFLFPLFLPSFILSFLLSSSFIIYYFLSIFQCTSFWKKKGGGNSFYSQYLCVSSFLPLGWGCFSIVETWLLAYHLQNDIGKQKSSKHPHSTPPQNNKQTNKQKRTTSEKERGTRYWLAFKKLITERLLKIKNIKIIDVK